MLTSLVCGDDEPGLRQQKAVVLVFRSSFEAFDELVSSRKLSRTHTSSLSKKATGCRMSALKTWPLQQAVRADYQQSHRKRHSTDPIRRLRSVRCINDALIQAFSCGDSPQLLHEAGCQQAEQETTQARKNPI